MNAAAVIYTHRTVFSSRKQSTNTALCLCNLLLLKSFNRFCLCHESKMEKANTSLKWFQLDLSKICSTLVAHCAADKMLAAPRGICSRAPSSSFEWRVQRCRGCTRILFIQPGIKVDGGKIRVSNSPSEALTHPPSTAQSLSAKATEKEGILSSQRRHKMNEPISFGCDSPLCSVSTLGWLMCAEPSRTRHDWERETTQILQNLDATTQKEEIKGGRRQWLANILSRH